MLQRLLPRKLPPGVRVFEHTVHFCSPLSGIILELGTPLFFSRRALEFVISNIVPV